jgi:hypothetical protein
MPINFPDSPTTGDTHTSGDKTWTYDGTAWNLVVGGVPTVVDTLTINQDAEVDGILTANHIHGNIAGSVYLHVKNTSGVTIPEGSPVYATGSVGASGGTEIAASDASTAATMPALGITQSELVANAEGHATILGVIESLDTSTYGLNDSLYVAPGGGLTDTRPTALTDLVQKIGRVVRVDGSTGEILVLGAGRTNDVPNNVVAGGLTIDTDTLHVASTSNRVGIGNADSFVSASSSVGSLVLSADENNEVGSSQMAFKVDGTTLMGLQASGNLEMVGGTVKGDGALVQMVSATSGVSDLTSSANIASITMSPKYSDSTMLVLVNFHAYKYNTSTSVNNQYQLYQSGGGNITPLRNYQMYSPNGDSYMFQGVVSGTIAAGSTASRTYHYYVTGRLTDRY